LIVVAVGLLVMVLQVTPVLAWPASYEGRPVQLQPGASAGFYVWQDAEGSHLATTGPGAEHRFRATILTDGQIVNVGGDRLEGGDSFTVGEEGHRLTIELATFGAADHVSWQVEGGTFMYFGLMLNGQWIDDQQIFVGAQGRHPLAAQFALYR
jgi:hypothetical protein